jgi:trans-2,3-dihydro-3-hydroxyanthranilate isomerase
VSSHRYVLADVFTDTPLTGNQLAVFTDGRGFDAQTMQDVAREMNLSETVFVLPPEAGGHARIRIFTPVAELPFAGHPTLGTAFVMVSEGRVSSPATQVIAAGEIPVEVDLGSNFAWMTQLPVEFGREFDDRALIARAIGLEVDDLEPGLPVQTVSTGLLWTIVPVRDADRLGLAQRDGRALGESAARSGDEGLYLFAVTEEGITARMFDATFGIGEDPATGSAAGPLGAYLAEHGRAGMPGSILVRQGEHVGRRSELHVEVADEDGRWRVRVGGGVHVVGQGAFRL